MIPSPLSLPRPTEVGPSSRQGVGDPDSQQGEEARQALRKSIEDHSLDPQLAHWLKRMAEGNAEELDLSKQDLLPTIPTPVMAAFARCLDQPAARKIVLPPKCQAVPGWLTGIRQLETVVMPQFAPGKGWDWADLTVLGEKVHLILENAVLQGDLQQRKSDPIVLTHVHLHKARLENVQTSRLIVRDSDWQDVNMTLSGEIPDPESFDEFMALDAKRNPYPLTFEACQLTDVVMPKVAKLKLILEGGRTTGLNLSGADGLELRLANGRFDLINLSAANVEGLLIHDSIAEYANFSEARFRQIDVEKSSLRSSRWTGALIGKPSGVRLEDDTQEQYEPRGLTFRAVDLRNAEMRQVQAEECGFDAECNFDGVDFAGATFVQAVMPGVDLRGSKSMHRATLKDCVISRTTRLPEGFDNGLSGGGAADIVQRNSVLLVTGAELGFGNAMKDLADRYGFHAISVRETWPRDQYSKRHIDADELTDVGVFSDQLEIGPLQRARMMHKFAFGMRPQGAAHGSKGHWRAISPTTGTAPVSGNMIVTEGGCCIIGNNEILHADSPLDDLHTPLDEVTRNKVEQSFPGATDVDLAARLWRQRKVAKQEVRQNLGPAAKVVILPQDLFHIDLQIAYLGGDLILVHSFQETLTLLEQHGAEHASVYGQAALDSLQAETLKLLGRFEGPVVDETVKRLEKAGLHPVKCCGALMSSIPQDKLMPDLMYSHFMNGVTIKDEQGKMLFVTADADGVDFHKDYFTGLCKGLGVNVEFIRCNNPRANPAAMILEAQGGVRCRSYNSTLGLLSFLPTDAK